MTDLKPSKELTTHLPQFSLAERDRRWNTLREKMAMRGLSCLLLWSNDLFYGMAMANFRYLTHCASLGSAYAIFPLEGKPLVFMSTPHQNVPYHACVGAQDWVDEIRPMLRMEAMTKLLKEMGHERGRIGVVGFGSHIVPENFTYRAYSQLLKGLPDAEVTEQTALVEEMRLIKSPEEIGMLERSGEITRKSLDAMVESAHVGARECEVWAEMMRAQVANGGEPHVFNLFTSGSVVQEPGVQQRLVHGARPPLAPTTRVLREGDLLICEVHGCYGGYLTAAEFSVFVGEPPQQLKALHKVAAECVERGLEKFQPGVTLRELVEAIRKPVREAGFDYVELGFHGHGLASPEFPTIVYKPGAGMLSGEGIGDFELRPGMVFGTNTDIQDPGWRSDVGVMLGDTILVTERGPKRLVNTPADLPCVR